MGGARPHPFGPGISLRCQWRPIRSLTGWRHTSPAPVPREVNNVFLDDLVNVNDDSIDQAMRWAFEHLKIVVGPSGAVALAALAGTGLPPGPTGVVVSGGSVDFGTFRALMAGLPDAKDRAVA
jgi:threonine dehydratase